MILLRSIATVRVGFSKLVSHTEYSITNHFATFDL